MFKFKVVLALYKYHKEEINMIVVNYLGLGEGSNIDDDLDVNMEDNLVNDSLSTDSSSSSENTSPISGDRKKDHWLILILGLKNNGGGGGSSPIRYIKSLASDLIRLLSFFQNNPFSGWEHSFTNSIFSLYLYEQISHFFLSYYACIIPILYIIHKYFVFYNKLYTFLLQFKAPFHFVSFADFLETTRIITSNDFIRDVAHRLAECEPKPRWSNYTKYNIPAYFRLRELKKRLGLVRANRLNLALETVHHSYAGAGLKCLLSEKFSSILVQITTKFYSQLHRQSLYGLFNILVITGVGVVVWYKFQLINTVVPPFIPESVESFKNPTAVVEGYEKVTYWTTKDIQPLVKHTFTHEKPFVDIINLNQFWGHGWLHKDQVTCIGTAIMVATFISTNVLIPQHA